MAKVMISIPDDLLRRLDARANAAGETRSGLLRRLAEADIDAAEAARRKHFEGLLEKATAPMGGNAAQLIREDRESH